MTYFGTAGSPRHMTGKRIVHVNTTCVWCVSLINVACIQQQFANSLFRIVISRPQPSSTDHMTWKCTHADAARIHAYTLHMYVCMHVRCAYIKIWYFARRYATRRVGYLLVTSRILSRTTCAFRVYMWNCAAPNLVHMHIYIK
jgi:hypothetical protein